MRKVFVLKYRASLKIIIVYGRHIGTTGSAVHTITNKLTVK
jgi:hypothetical protein